MGEIIGIVIFLLIGAAIFGGGEAIELKIRRMFAKRRLDKLERTLAERSKSGP
jgi:hypothetical protein